jgi:hypothetical protein
VSQTVASLNHAAESTIKCFRCGLTNFRTADQCKRCKSDLSQPFTGGIDNIQVLENSADPARSTVRLAVTLVAVLAVLTGLVLFYMRPGPQAAPEALNRVGAEQPATSQPQAEAQEVPMQQNPQSAEAASKVLGELKSFQQATEGSLSYAEYDEKLTRLNSDLNNTLSEFVGHSPGDETFRQETAAAVREYAAARSWWKTTIQSNSPFNEADRNERLQADWTSAKTHLENAEKVMPR